MKKILLLVLVLISIKINAYEYLIYNHENATVGVKLIYYYDNDNILKIKRIDSNGSESSSYSLIYNNLNGIKYNSQYYMKNLDFINIYKSDINFLNGLYTTNTFTLNSFLNYLYNDNYFSSQNHIDYNDFQILYNEDGYAVESKVNGVYAGLYDNENIDKSGYLYDFNGKLVLVNGEEAGEVHKLSQGILKTVKDVFLSCHALTPLNKLMKGVIVITLLIFVIKLSRRVIKGNGRTNN